MHADLMLIAAILIASLDLVIVMGSNNRASKIFVYLSFLSAIWVISQVYLITTNVPDFAELLIRSQYIMGIIIACGFYVFSIIYPDNGIVKLYEKICLILSILVISYLYTFTDLLVKGVTNIGGIGRWSWQFGTLHPLFDIVFTLIWILALSNLFRSYKNSDGILKINMKHMFWGLTLGIIPPSLANIILPTLGIYKLNWTGPIASAIWVFVIGYSIMRYRQMNVKVVITEMLAVAMTIIFFINIFVKAQFGTAENVMTFLIFLLIATYLIRTVLSEERIKEQLRVLNNTLEEKVAEQTQEIRKALENEKQARKNLEKLNETKNQFVMITQHSIRSPLQNLKSAVEEITEQIPPALKNRIEHNTSRLKTVVDDFLNIATINNGGKILNLEKTALLPIVEKVISELDFDIKAKNLNVTISSDHSNEPWPTLNIDPHKFYEAIFIILENAIKYNKNGGQIHISQSTDGDNCVVEIKDTGIGLSGADLQKIKDSLFYRGEKAKEQNPIGMGIGLSVAKAIIKAHHGSLSISSDGVDKGTTVTVEVPFDYLKALDEMV